MTTPGRTSANRSRHGCGARPVAHLRALSATHILGVSESPGRSRHGVPSGLRHIGCSLRGLKMSRVPTLNSPFLLGFDEIERALDRVAKAASDGYPPYNIERLPRTEDEPERLRITLAVAGFTRDQLEILLEENQLVIRGRQHDDKQRTYLHRGIAARQFQRTFLLAEGMEVLGADLSNGLLSIDMARPEPERIIRKIDISARD